LTRLDLFFSIAKIPNCPSQLIIVGFFNLGGIKMKKQVNKVLVALLLSVATVPLLAVTVFARPLENDFHTRTDERFIHNYRFSSGPDYRDALGRPTQTDLLPFNPSQTNARRDAGASFNPPPQGFGNGVFATDINNFFATQSNTDYAQETTNFANSNTGTQGFDRPTNSTSLSGGLTGGQILPSTSILEGATNINNSQVTITNQQNARPIADTPPIVTHTPNFPQNNLPISNVTTPITAPSFFNDGSMARLSIPRIGLNNMSVFHGVGYNIIDNHIGHFPTTSAWDGNIGLAAHNSGRAGYFQNLHLLGNGDTITVSTPRGARTYRVVSSQVIHETDFSLLGWSNDNRITLITCVAGQPQHRLAVVAVEVR